MNDELTGKYLALASENEQLRDLVIQRMADDDMFFEEHPEEETIFLAEWTEAAKKVLEREPSC